MHHPHVRQVSVTRTSGFPYEHAAADRGIAPLLYSGAIKYTWKEHDEISTVDSVYSGQPSYDREKAWKALETRK